jgi:NAD(P)-dependent dehydrogenase (short-subunit alcohol dehydrogenase family)
MVMSEVVVVIGAGSIGQAIAPRVSAGKHVVLADLHQSNADAAAGVMADAGFEVSTATVDVSSRESIHALVETSTAFGEITGVIHAAGVSPSQASPEAILHVDLYGTAVLRAPHGPRRRVYHRQRLPHGRRCYRLLLLRRARPALIEPFCLRIPQCFAWLESHGST